jgi:hypothetical protein
MTARVVTEKCENSEKINLIKSIYIIRRRANKPYCTHSPLKSPGLVVDGGLTFPFFGHIQWNKCGVSCG